MKTILVPTDFSKNSQNALNYAVKLAGTTNAKIILLHAFHITYITPDMPGEYTTEQVNAVEMKSNKCLNALCKKVKKSGTVTCETINKQGLAVDVIVDIIKNKKVDLVVMGTKGASGIKEIFIGTNTAKVIEKATCPVIAVPEKVSFEEIKNITYATDYHASDISALKQLVDIFKNFKPKINMVHISEGEYTNETENAFINAFIKKVNQKINYNNISYHLIYSEDIEKKLEDYLKKKPPHLIVMSTRYRNLIEKLFGKSITKKLVYHTQVPLLAFHYKKEPVVFI